MEPLEITIGVTEVTAEPVDGYLEDGTLMVESFNWELEGPVFKAVEGDDAIEWAEDKVGEQIRAHWMENELWPDVSVTDWSDKSRVNQDTVKWDILEYVWNNQPVKSTDVDDALELEGTSSAYISKMKDSKLLASIGKDGRSQVLVTTHVGAKELSHVHGKYISVGDSGGLNSLFDKVDESDEE